MPAVTLTDVWLRQYPKPLRREEFGDLKVPGLVVRISPDGAKAFSLRYRNLGGRQQRYPLGRYPTTALAAARDRARDIKRQVEAGKDPALERKQARKEYDNQLFGQVLDEFIETYAKPKLRGWPETRRLLNREFKAWRDWPIASIERQDVSKVLNAIVARGSPSAANHAFAAIRKLFNWAVEQDHLPASPCAKIKAPTPHRSRDRVLSAQELVSVWQAAEAMGYPYGRMVQLLILTAQRRGEVAGVAWAELDLAKAQWSLPARRTKANRAHTLPLSPGALAIIENLPRLHDELVFPAQNKDVPVSGFSKWRSELVAAGAEGDWRLHDLRRTVASGMAELRVPPHVIEKVLNHTNGILGGVAGIYNRFGYLDEMRSALNQWATYVAMLLWAATLPE